MVRHPLHSAAEVSLASCVAFGALALGGAPEWALWPIAALGVLAGALVVTASWRTGQRTRWSPVLWLPIGGLALCLLQVVPLPPSIQGLLSPRGAELKTFALVPLGIESWRPISIEPAATFREVAKHATYAAVLFASLQLGRSRSARARLLAMLVAVGATVALIGLIHRLLGFETLFGFYAYAHPQNLLTTIGNPNHLAALLTVCGVVSTGLAVAAEHPRQAALWASAAIVIAIGAVLSLSRGGVGFFLAAHAVLALAVLAHRGSRSLVPVAIAMGAVGVALFLAADQLFERLHTLDSVSKLQQSKIELWPVFGEAAAAYARAGMGRGAFEVAFTPFQHHELKYTFTHPENFVLQLAAELGGAATLVFTGVAVTTVVSLVRAKRLGVVESAALIAAGAAVAHDIFDFALELPATALAATVATGAAFSVTAETSRKVPLAVGAAGAVGAVICLAVAWAFGRPSLADDEKTLRELIAAQPTLETLRPRALALIDRHPGDYLLYSMMADDAARRGDPRESLAWVNRVLYLRPADANAHTTAALALLRLGRTSQALGEFRLAIASGDRTGMDLALKTARSADELDYLASDQTDLLIELSTRLRRSGRTQDAEAVLTRHVSPTAPLDLILHAADVTSERGDHQAALAMLQAAAQREPESSPVMVALARELSALGDAEKAAAVLNTALVRAPDSPEVGLALVQLQLNASRPAKAREVVKRVLPFTRDSRTRARLLYEEGRAHQAEGHPALAVRSLQTVVQLDPAIPGYYYELAGLQETLGRLKDARATVARGIEVAGPKGAAARPWLERLDHALEAKSNADHQKLLELVTDAGTAL